MNRSFQDTSRSAKPVILGGTFIFSNSLDGYISPTLLERFGDTSVGSTDSEPGEDEAEQVEIESFGCVEDKDIVVFATTPVANIAKPKCGKPRVQDDDPSLREPFFSPHKKDVISFFLTEIGRQKSLDDEARREDLPTQTVAEPTPDCSSTERDQVLENADIISFSVKEADRENNILSTSAPSPKHDSNLRKPYVSLNYSDIISFYQNEDGLLKAYETEVPQNEEDAVQQCDKSMSDVEVEDDNDLDKSDIHIFYNNGPPAHVVTSTPKHSAKQSKLVVPLVINKNSIVTFYSNESSFLAAIDANLSNVVDGQNIKEASLEEVSVSPENEPDEVQEDVDIKVFSNNRPDLGLEDTRRNKTAAVRSDSPVLVVTQEFPDIISFYNPNLDKSNDLKRPPTKSRPQDNDLPIDIPRPIDADGDTHPGSLNGGDVYVERPKHKTCTLEYVGSSMWEKPSDPPMILVPQNTREKLVTPTPENVLEEEDAFDDMPGLEEEGDSNDEDDVSSHHNSSVVIEDSHSEDGTPVRAIQDIENLTDIEKAINMIDAIKDLEIEDLDMRVPEPIADNYDDDILYDIDDFELDDFEEDIESFLSESERLTPLPRNLDTASEDAAFVEHYFDNLDDPEEFLLKTVDPESNTETPNSESAIIEFITQNMEKYMDLSPMENGQRLPFAKSSVIDVTDINDAIADAVDAIAGIEDLITDEGSIALPGCATPTPAHPPRCNENDADSDAEYKTMFEALNKPLLPPIEKSEESPLQKPSEGEYKPCLPYKGQEEEKKKIGQKNKETKTEPPACSLEKVLSKTLLSEIVQHPLAAGENKADMPPGGSVNETRSDQSKDCIANAIENVLFYGVPPNTPATSSQPKEPAKCKKRPPNISPSSAAKSPSKKPSTKSPPKEVTTKSPSNEKKEPLSPRSSLAKSIVERISSPDRKILKSVKPSDIVKLDRKLFSELQKKFSKPRDKMSSFRSKIRNKNRRATKWRPVEVVPDQVISYNQVNAVDVEVYIPDIDERRTPIARLFNDTSPSKKSPSPPGTSPGARIISPAPNVFVPIDIPGTPLKRRFPSPRILRKVALFEGLAFIDSKRRPVSPGPESKYLAGSLDNLTDDASHDCECDTHLTHQVRYKWASQESGIYDGTLKPAGQRRVPEMFRPTWRRGSTELEADRPRSTSPHWRSFSEAALGVTGVNGTFEGHIPSPSSRPLSRTRNLSYESGREESLVKNSIGSQTNTHVDRLARSGSAASLAVVMASTFPNGGDANFDLEGTAQKINEVCKTFSNSQNDVSSSGVNITRSRSMNSALNVIHNPEAKAIARPLYFGARSTINVRIRATPEKRICQPIRATRPSPSYKEIKELQEKLKTATEISYSDLITCPRNRLPQHIDKLQLQNCLSDHEFVEVFRMRKEDFKRLAPWKRAHLKKEVLLF